MANSIPAGHHVTAPEGTERHQVAARGSMLGLIEWWLGKTARHQHARLDRAIEQSAEIKPAGSPPASEPAAWWRRWASCTRHR